MEITMAGSLGALEVQCQHGMLIFLDSSWFLHVKFHDLDVAA